MPSVGPQESLQVLSGIINGGRTPKKKVNSTLSLQATHGGFKLRIEIPNLMKKPALASRGSGTYTGDSTEHELEVCGRRICCSWPLLITLESQL